MMSMNPYKKNENLVDAKEEEGKAEILEQREGWVEKLLVSAEGGAGLQHNITQAKTVERRFSNFGTCL